MPLFNPKTVAAALAGFAREPSEPELASAAQWAQQAEADFHGQNESQLEPGFNAVLMQGALGYRALAPECPGTIKAKQPVGGGTIDLAIGHFTATRAAIVAPCELKGPKTGLDAIMPGRAKTPVQQAWEYANDAVGAKWVLVSNMRELRLYAVGHGRAAFESFDLRRIGEREELKRLQLVLHAEQLLGGATAELLERSAREDREITNQLYATYKSLREDLLQFVRDGHPEIAAERRIALVQKLLDRLIFVAFAEDTVLLPDKSIERAVKFANPYDPQPKWVQVQRLFSAVNDGHPKALGIDAYNGGLFAPDARLDALAMPDHLVARFLDIADYDFKSQVSVTILGHIFEQSISDIEALQAEARGEAPPKAGKRKRDGVVYTPDFVTAFIVERTIGLHLREIADALLEEHSRGAGADGAMQWKTKASERDYWRAYLERLTALRILDPACGSGAFLIAAFDVLRAEQRRVRERLGEIDGGILAWADPNADAEIITRNLHGVDVNAESVEITRLSLWLKTAKKGRPLESLDLNIRCGNSLIEDSDFHARAFVWERDFPEILAGGGFDIVIGNPPYVRMELLKPIKPYLEKRYAVVSDRADLYAYFFELGVRLLKPGGRLGYISSSTFFRTGSGAPLRSFLGAEAEIETVVDFGDLQLFEGVTTYPAILTMRRKHAHPSPSGEGRYSLHPSPSGEGQGVGPVAAAGSDNADGTFPTPTPPLKGRGLDDGTLQFLNLRTLPADLALAFAEGAEPMPRARLTATSWRFEGARLDAIRARMAAGRPTLAQVYGAPLYGIKTGLNEAFVLDRATRDALVAADANSAHLLKPFLIGENLKRWHVESDDLWLIYTPRNKIDIEAYPAIRDHLLPFKDRLERRATRQNWWELQQAQAAYEAAFDAPKIAYCDISNQPTFSIDRTGARAANTVYFVPGDDAGLCALLNSRAAWFYLRGLTNIAQNGYLRLRTEFVSQLPIPDRFEPAELVTELHDLAESLAGLRNSTLHRLADIHPAIESTAAFRAWPDLDFAQLRALIAKRFKTDIAPGERDDWERWYEAKRAEAAALRARIADAEAEIDARTYALFGLDADDVRFIEESLAGQY